jgi:hypothetical protein
LESTWCQRELEIFSGHHQASLAGRIFVVEIDPIAKRKEAPNR